MISRSDSFLSPGQLAELLLDRSFVAFGDVSVAFLVFWSSTVIHVSGQTERVRRLGRGLEGCSNAQARLLLLCKHPRLELLSNLEREELAGAVRFEFGDGSFDGAGVVPAGSVAH